MVPVRFNGSTPNVPFDSVPLYDFDIVPWLPKVSLRVTVVIQAGHSFDDIDPDWEDKLDGYDDIYASADDAHEPLHPIGPNEYYSSYPVDGLPSCAFHHGCTSHPKRGSRFCHLHHRIVARRWIRYRIKVYKRNPSMYQSEDNRSRQDISFHMPKDLRPFQLLLDLDKSRTMLTIDVEFATPRDVNIVSFAVCIRELRSGKILVYTAIKYDMELDAMEQAFIDHARAHSRIPGDSKSLRLQHYQNRGYFGRFYQRQRTTGVSLAAMGDMIRTAGFRPETHCVLSWYSSAGINVFQRALAGDNALISFHDYGPTKSDYLQPVNLAVMLRHCTDAENVRCGYVHQNLYPDSRLVMHLPDNETLPMCEIYGSLMERMPKWCAA